MSETAPVANCETDRKLEAVGDVAGGENLVSEAVVEKAAVSNGSDVLDGTSGKATKKAARKAQKEARRAYKKTRPKMPKWLHFITVLFALNFILTIMGLVFTSRDLVDYGAANLLDWANVVFEMVMLWMLWCRFKVARCFAMGYTAFNMLVGFTNSVIEGHFDPLGFLIGSLFDVMLFVYFLTSKKTKAYLTEDFGIDQKSAAPYVKELSVNRRSWAFFRNLIIYYCFFSLAGHWMESAFCMLIRAGIVAGEVDLNNTMLWRDWFYPFPMEGIAVVLIAVFLYPLFMKLLKTVKFPGVAYLVSFVVNGLVCVAIEYAMGMFVNADLQLWDYRNMPFNLNGMICLQNGVGFAFAASVICWAVYPALERLFARIPENVMNLVFVVTLTAYMIPQALYLTDPPVSYKEEIEAQLADENLSESTRAELQADLDKLNALEEQGATLAGAPDSRGVVANGAGSATEAAASGSAGA